MKESTMIFISHAGCDIDSVSPLVNVLRTAFPTTTIFCSSDSDSLQPGDDWWDKLRQSLAKADIVLACVSRLSAGRPWILFEAGYAMGHASTLIPLIIDDLLIDELGQPLNMLQAVRLDAKGIIHLVKLISAKLSLEPKVMPADIAVVDYRRPIYGVEPGVYAGGSRLDFQSGWIRYRGDPKTLFVNRNYVTTGSSFSDGFRYPPVDSLTAPWRCFGFRFLSNDEVWMYAVLKLIDGTFRTLIASTAVTSWGFTSEPLDEYRIPLGNLKSGRWYVAIIDVQSIEHDLPSQIQCIVGFKARGPLSISHIWCVNSQDDIPNKYSKNAHYVRYPR